MVCPVCVVDGFVIASCRFLGVPDVITAFLIGIITLSLAMVTLKYLKRKLMVETSAPKGSLLFILAVYSVVTIAAMKYLGMF